MISPRRLHVAIYIMICLLAVDVRAGQNQPGQADWQMGEVLSGILVEGEVESFEEPLGAKGLPATWSSSDFKKNPPADGSQVFRRVEGGRTGQYCLEGAKTDPAVYVIASKPIDIRSLTLDKEYILEGWMNTDELEGAEACIQLEYWTADGRYIGGGGTLISKPDTKGWTRYRATFRGRYAKADELPPGAKTYLICYLRRGATGKARFDDICVREYRKHYAAGLVTDRYRNVTAGGVMKIRAGLMLKDHGLTPDAIAATCRIEDAEGNTVAELQPTKFNDQWVQFETDTTDLRIGKYALRVEVAIPSRDDLPPITLHCDLSRVEKLPNRKVYVDDHRRLIVKGKPFFPLGVFHAFAYMEKRQPRKGPKHVQRIAEGGFNCIMSYSNPNDEQLKRIHKHGIYWMFCFSNAFAPNDHRNLKTVDDEKRFIEQKVNAYRNDPNLLAWYTGDERHLEDVPHMRKRHDWLKQLDPDHPNWVLNNKSSYAKDFINTCDILSDDPYPVPIAPLDWTLLRARRAARGTLGLRTFWMVPQMFNKGTYRPARDEYILEYRAPDYRELRCMSWTCIAAGANGLVFYNYKDLWRAHHMKREHFDYQWLRATTVAKEIRSQFDVLLSTDAPPEPIRVQAHEDTPWRLWKQDGAVYLLTTNIDVVAHDVSLTFDTPFAHVEPVIPGSFGRLAGKTVHVPHRPVSVSLIKLTPAKTRRETIRP